MIIEKICLKKHRVFPVLAALFQLMFFMVKDIIGLREERSAGEPLLQPVMKQGKGLGPLNQLNEIRERLQKEFMDLDNEYKTLTDPPEYPVELGTSLRQLQKKVIHRITEKEPGES